MIAAVVTGHTRGLGAAIAENLLERRIAVLGLARGSSAALAQRFPDRFSEVALDLSDGEALARWLAGDTLARFLQTRATVLLINDAGTLQPIGPPAMQDPAAVARAVMLGVAAPLMLSAAVAAARPAGSDCRILHISSGAARKPYAGWSVYCASKAALDHHARAVALEALPGVRIAAMAPGVLDTDMQAEIRASSLEQFPLRDRFAEMQRSGGLTAPSAAARRLMDFLLDDEFGAEPVGDLRELTG